MPRECDDIIANVSGVYEIYPDGTSRSASVYCNMDKTDKWTVRFLLLVTMFLSSCNSIKTFDFSTLYTTIPHSNLNDKLRELV